MSSTSLSELFKIPELIEHYSAHLEENGEMSILDFIHQHYSEDDSSQDTNHKHCNLPFKKHEQGSVLYQFIFLSEPENTMSPFRVATNNYLNPENSELLSFYQQSIWQPPQIG